MRCNERWWAIAVAIGARAPVPVPEASAVAEIGWLGPMPRTRQITFFVVGFFLVLGLGVFAFSFHAIRQEQKRIRVRYQQMMAAISAGDTNAVLAVAPEWRSSFDDLQLSRFEDFAQPLGPHSSIRISGREATVWPVRTSHYIVLPGGHTVEMIKVADDWFFTGKVHVD
jgi:hypothetical protein